MNLTVNNVKLTFFQYPFPIPHTVNYDKYILMPNLLDLAAMKAFVLGRISKWKDYVDLYFLIKYHFTVNEIAERVLIYFTDLFSEKLFRSQLAYHNFINFEEEVIYTIAPIRLAEIKEFLINKATEQF